MKSIIYLSVFIILLGYTYSRAFNIVGKSGYCVAAANGRSRLTQHSCINANNVLWSKIWQSGKWILRCNNGYVMDLKGYGNNGDPIQAWTRNNSVNQLWSIRDVGHGQGLLVNARNGKCLDDTGRKGYGQFYHLWTCSRTNKNQIFIFRYP